MTSRWTKLRHFLSHSSRACVRPALLLLVVSLLGTHAWAQCATPTGTLGEMRWDSGTSLVRYCDGTSWSSMSSAATANACSSAGEIKYNSGEVQFCNGSVWHSMNAKSLMGTCSTAGLQQFDSTINKLKWCDGTNWRLLGGAPPDVTVSLASTSSSPSNATSYTFTGLSFGTPTNRRYLVVGFGMRAGSATSISSVTVAGTAATLLGTVSATGAFTYTAFYLVYMPTGTSGDIVVATPGNSARVAISVWAVENLQTETATSHGDQSGGGSPPGINISAGGAAFGLTVADSGTGVTWTNLVEDSDFIVTDTLNMNASGAAKTFSTAQTSYAISWATGGSWSSRGGKVLSLR